MKQIMNLVQHFHGFEQELRLVYGSFITRGVVEGSSLMAGTSRWITGRDATPKMQVQDHFATDSNYRSRAAIVTTGNEGETFWQRDILNCYYREFMLQFSQAETLRLQEAEKKRKIREMQQKRRQLTNIAAMKLHFNKSNQKIAMNSIAAM